MKNPFKQPKPKLVRLHHEKTKESFEGIWTGMYQSHYVLEAPEVIFDKTRHKLEGPMLIPAAKVTFLQELAKSVK